MVLNYIAFKEIIGDLPAMVISGLFEVAIIAWKFTTSRRKNDAKQNQLATWAVWLSVALAVTMLFVNLFRVGGDTHFETLAYSIVGIAAIVQVVFYLMYDGANPDKKMVREHAQAQRELARKRSNARNVVEEVEADMQIVRYIRDELNALAKTNSDLPTPQLEYLLENARQKLLAEYAGGKADVANATKGFADLDGDGKIGNKPVQQAQTQNKSF